MTPGLIANRLTGEAARAGDEGTNSLIHFTTPKGGMQMEAGTRLAGIASALALALFVSACSSGPSEPSDAELTNAMRAPLKETDPEEKLFKVHSVKKLGCKADGDRVYKCDVRIDVTELGTRTEKAGTIRLAKSDKGWMLMAN